MQDSFMWIGSVGNLPPCVDWKEQSAAKRITACHFLVSTWRNTDSIRRAAPPCQARRTRFFQLIGWQIRLCFGKIGFRQDHGPVFVRQYWRTKRPDSLSAVPPPSTDSRTPHPKVLRQSVQPGSRRYQPQSLSSHNRIRRRWLPRLH